MTYPWWHNAVSSEQMFVYIVVAAIILTLVGAALCSK